ncbi:SUMF1/EgtB/PvdO family nonheme iron enzyme [Pontibacter sp. G13]|uniref:formylglycine-generating enzyme family protein n=1 Tax=Pontibacter sp. G13 TaxID=3074898 RepID=UPI00288B1319|nr:SUMF1/EgtB/PvdO family nonheme iron enzyme [Pontibacter sp. G13]WNJ17508.1 SUMF1/EgtB/PvdO family nonheme iron enzyme [Pontibacter sp. G13]
MTRRYFACLLGCLMLAAPRITLAQTEIQLPTFSQTVPGTAVSFDMVCIPAGTFQMGSPESDPDREADEGPLRMVELDSFWIGTMEVSFELYNLFRERELDNGETNASFAYDADAVTRPSPPYEDPTFGMGKTGYPAVSMTQYAALRFCKWLWQKTGVFYRLPTEAEWEYACRAGTSTRYSFGDDIADLDEYGWHYDNSDETYHLCGTKKPNPWGLYDMHGNVSEWCLDQYQANFLTLLPEQPKNPWQRPTSLHPRTVKGGSWDDDPEELRTSNRIESSPNWKKRDPQIPKSFWWNTDSPFVGFRLVRPVNPGTEEDIRAFWKQVLDE